MGKIEKDKGLINNETTDVRAAVDEMARSKASVEKSNKGLIATLNDLNKKVEEANMTINDYEGAKRKIVAENADLLRQVQELETSASMLYKVKIQQVSQFDEAKKCADDESRERIALLGKYKNLEHQIDGMKEQLDEESASRDDVTRMLNKSQGEADMWCSKFEQECTAKAEELEMAK